VIRESENLLSSLWTDEVENDFWAEFLDSFAAVKNLFLTDETVGGVCGALQELPGDRAGEVLPALRCIFIDGFTSFEEIEETIGPFVAARQHRVTIDHWQASD